MKKFTTWFLLLVLAAWSAPAAARPIIDGIAAVVNREVITIRELDDAMAPFLDKIPKTVSKEERAQAVQQARTAILNRLVDQALVQQEGNKLGIVIKEEDVTAYIGGMLERRKITMEKLIEMLAKEGTTLNMLKEEIRNQMLRIRIAQKEIRSKITVSEDEIGDYYALHRSDYEGKDSIKFRQILIPVTKETEAQARRKLKADAETILRRLKAGEAFETLEAEYAGYSRSAGDLGFVEKGAMLPVMEEAAFKLKVGEFSGIIETPQGLHIIKVIDRRGRGIKPLDDVRAEIKSEIIDDKMQKKIPDWIRELREKSYVDIRI
ncbi:MAG TPA: peptidylprolyl isomerase [Syntrophales bacterium]|nr:peptidylprolyl isomerase [Syntrophales bacterium]HPL62752.1 peptidylprolyl isomerase [Syntrophales bacterium]